MAAYYRGFSYRELIYEGLRTYQPVPGDDCSAWLAARELWPTPADAAATVAAHAVRPGGNYEHDYALAWDGLATAVPPLPAAAASSSSSNNNNDDDDDFAVARAGPATAEPQWSIEPDLLPPSPAAAAPTATTTDAAAAPVAPAAAPALPAAAPPPAPPLPSLPAAAPGPARGFVPPQRGRYRPWSPREEATLRLGREAFGEDFGRLGAALNRTAASCETKAKTLGIYKWGKPPRS